jgi:hypothetical protein
MVSCNTLARGVQQISEEKNLESAGTIQPSQRQSRFDVQGLRRALAPSPSDTKSHPSGGRDKGDSCLWPVVWGAVPSDAEEPIRSAVSSLRNRVRAPPQVVDFVAAKASGTSKAQTAPEGRLQILPSEADKITEIRYVSTRRCPWLRTRGSGARISPGAPFSSTACGRWGIWGLKECSRICNRSGLRGATTGFRLYSVLWTAESCN